MVSDLEEKSSQQLSPNSRRARFRQALESVELRIDQHQVGDESDRIDGQAGTEMAEITLRDN